MAVITELPVWWTDGMNASWEIQPAPTTAYLIFVKTPSRMAITAPRKENCRTCTVSTHIPAARRPDRHAASRPSVKGRRSSMQMRKTTLGIPPRLSLTVETLPD
jgi:hypothetical protein